MIVRRKFLPKSLLDMTCCGLLIFVFIPYIYWFEIYIVLPYFYKIWSLWYILHWLCGNFAAINIMTNLVALILCDTSVKGRVIPANRRPGWSFCSVCETIVPPRSWHCETCQTCILKRDHHCVFSGCCVGHDNYRYFFIFVLYTFIALVYSTYFNSFYVWNVVDFKNVSWINVVFPLAMVVFEYTPQQFVLLVYLLLTIGMFFCGLLLYLHVDLVRHGQVSHERGLNIRIYDAGLLENIKNSLGKKWYLTWIFPFIISELSHDGINWKIYETEKFK